MDGWIDELAAELGEDPLTSDEATRLLGAAREVAHRVERRITPLAAFVLGSAVGRAEASGMDRPRALDGVFETLERLLPEPRPDAPDAASPIGGDEGGPPPGSPPGDTAPGGTLVG